MKRSGEPDCPPSVSNNWHPTLNPRRNRYQSQTDLATIMRTPISGLKVLESYKTQAGQTILR